MQKQTNRLDAQTLEARIERFGLSEQVADKIRRTDRCFILGMGPSLAKINPTAFENEFVIGVNYILKTPFVPDIICVTDNRRVDLGNWPSSDIKVLTVRQIHALRQEFIESINAYYDIDYVDYSDLRRNVLTIDDFDQDFKQVFWGGSVITDLAIPFATYMGMSNVYVLGLDGVSASFPSSHVWGNVGASGAAHSSKMFHMHEKTAALAARAGTRVFNASPGGIVEAFEKIDLREVLRNGFTTRYDWSLAGKSIVVKNVVMTIVEGSLEEQTYCFFDEKSERYLRHKNGKLIFDTDDGSELFKQDSHFFAEPSFVNPDWLALRSFNIPKFYVTAVDETSSYVLRTPADVFSPYFSSFRAFDKREQAQTRLDTDRILNALAQLKAAVGNIMIRNDNS